MMVLIFYLSSQEADASTQTSTNIGRGIILIKSSILDENLSDVEIEEQAIYIDHAVRKTAHATEYMILGILVFSGFVGNVGMRNTKLKHALTSWIIVALYAGSDEIHQFFVPGRSAQFGDVCIDSAGAAVGIVMVYFIVSYIAMRVSKVTE